MARAIASDSTARSACPPRRANAFGARAGDDDHLVFDPVHEALPSLPPWELLQSATVTRKKVAGMEVASLPELLFWLANNSSRSLCRSAARPFFSAASNAFMVGP